MKKDITLLNLPQYKKNKEVYYIYLYLNNLNTKQLILKTSLIENINNIISKHTNNSNLQLNFIIMDSDYLSKKDQKTTLIEYNSIENFLQEVLKPHKDKIFILSKKYNQLRHIQTYITKIERDLYKFCQTPPNDTVDDYDYDYDYLTKKNFNTQLVTIFESINNNIKDSSFIISYKVITNSGMIHKYLTKIEKTKNRLINITMDELKICNTNKSKDELQ